MTWHALLNDLHLYMDVTSIACETNSSHKTVYRLKNNSADRPKWVDAEVGVMPTKPGSAHIAKHLLRLGKLHGLIR